MDMTRRERLWGAIYGLFQLLILPNLLFFLNGYLPVPLEEGPINFIFFSVNFLFILLICHRFLWQNLLYAGRNLGKTLRFAFWGFILYYCANLLYSMIVLKFLPDFVNINDSSIMEITREHPVVMTLGAVLLVPMVEETIYRGVIFRGILNRSKFLAYTASALLFAAIHIAGYVTQYDALTLVVCLAQYLPAGLILAWSYEKSGTIVSPILIHMTVNQIGMLLTR